jgi:hypothetical protein
MHRSIILGFLIFLQVFDPLSAQENDDFIPLNSRANKVVEDIALKVEVSSPVTGRIAIGFEQKIKKNESFYFKLAYFLPYFKTGNLLADQAYSIPYQLDNAIGGGVAGVYRFSFKKTNLGSRNGLGFGLELGYAKYRGVTSELFTAQISTQYYHQWMLGRKRFIEIETGPSFGWYNFQDPLNYTDFARLSTQKWWGTVFLRLNYARLR